MAFCVGLSTCTHTSLLLLCALSWVPEGCLCALSGYGFSRKVGGYDMLWNLIPTATWTPLGLREIQVTWAQLPPP